MRRLRSLRTGMTNLLRSIREPGSPAAPSARTKFVIPIREYSPLCLSEGLCWGKAIEVGRGSVPEKDYRSKEQGARSGKRSGKLEENQTARRPFLFPSTCYLLPPSESLRSTVHNRR